MEESDDKSLVTIVTHMHSVLRPVLKKYLPNEALDPASRLPGWTFDDQFGLNSKWAFRDTEQKESYRWHFGSNLVLTDKELGHAQTFARCDSLHLDFQSANCRGVYLVSDRILSVNRFGVVRGWMQAHVFCGGDVEAADLTLGSILIADGNVKMTALPGSNYHFAVIATGDITSDRLYVRASCLIAGGSIKSSQKSDTSASHLYAGGTIDLVEGPKSKFGKHTAGYDFAKTGLKFFTLAEVADRSEGGRRAGRQAGRREVPIPEGAPGGRHAGRGERPEGDDARRVQAGDAEAVVLEYAILKGKRKDEAFARVVYLPGVVDAKK